MIRLAANVSLLFTERPFLERFAWAADAGFSGVEFHWPDGIATGDISAAVAESGLRVALMNFYGGDLSAGERGVIADPDRVGEFRSNVPVALELARAVGCHRLNALVGKRLAGLTVDRQLALARDALADAADAAARQGAEVLIEPVNTADNGPCLVSTLTTASRLARSTGRANVRLQFDAYHASRSGEDVLASVRRWSDQIAHVQVADDPGRHEPGTGRIPFERFLGALREVGYDDWLGLEYVPSDGDTEASLRRLWRAGWDALR